MIFLSSRRFLCYPLLSSLSLPLLLSVTLSLLQDESDTAELLLHLSDIQDESHTSQTLSTAEKFSAFFPFFFASWQHLTEAQGRPLTSDRRQTLISRQDAGRSVSMNGGQPWSTYQTWLIPLLCTQVPDSTNKLILMVFPSHCLDLLLNTHARAHTHALILSTCCFTEGLRLCFVHLSVFC